MYFKYVIRKTKHVLHFRSLLITDKQYDFRIPNNNHRKSRNFVIHTTDPSHGGSCVVSSIISHLLILTYTSTVKRVVKAQSMVENLSYFCVRSSLQLH